MTFAKGNSGNPTGKPKGARNKYKRVTHASYDIKAVLKKYKCDPIKTLCWIANNDLDNLNLTPEQKKYYSVRLMMEAAAQLAQYIVPRLATLDPGETIKKEVSVSLNFGNPSEKK